jgi:hypothetical protein
MHDPVWFLARQWLMGEHQGENATTPVLVDLQATQTPIEPSPQVPMLDPQAVPAEAIVEAEPDDWWTIGRRIRVGAVAAARAGLDVGALDARYRFAPPPPPLDGLGSRLPAPYERLAGRGDGLALWRDRAALGIGDAPFAGLGIPSPRPLLWRSDELSYDASFPIGDAAAARTLRLAEHGGGRLDWYSADATPEGFVPAGDTAALTRHPTPVEYPGAPRSRWWEIEDAAVDIGGYPPDTSHFATTLLIDLIASHGDDWFVFPIGGSAGHVLTIDAVSVTDSFGETYGMKPPADWWLFRTAGLDDRSLTVWLCALAPLEGQPLEDVLVELDEYSNVLWAVERRVAGHDMLQPPAAGNAPTAATAPGERKRFAYLPGRDAATRWHPYQVEDRPDGEGAVRRRFVQRRLAI